MVSLGSRLSTNLVPYGDEDGSFLVHIQVVGAPCSGLVRSFIQCEFEIDSGLGKKW